MKILQAIANARHGGLPEHVLALSRELRRRGHEIQVLSMSEGPMVAEFERAGISISTIPFLGHEMRRDPLLARKAIRYTRGLIQEAKPGIVHSHGPRAGIIAGRASRFSGSPPLMATAHGSFRQFVTGNRSEFGWLRGRLKRFQYVGIDRYTARAADRVIAVCEATRSDLVDVVDIPAEKVRVIHNGVAGAQVSKQEIAGVRPELGLDASHKLVIYVGRIAFHKGTPDLVEAAAAIGWEVPEARILIVGEGPLGGELKEQVASRGLQDKFIFTGDRRDAVRIMAAADLFVLPSLSEGLALTLLEAAMSSLALVATDVGGNPEVVRPGETGLLVPPRDQAALADAVVTLLKDDERRKRMGTAAHKLWQSEFTIERMVDRTEALYQELVEEHIDS